MAYKPLVTLCLAFVALSAFAGEQLSGSVDLVKDGDSIIVGGVEVRLLSIDAPEKSQPLGAEARDALTRFCPVGSLATVETFGTERYGRTLGVVTCGGVEVNAELVRLGLAWVYVRFAPKDSPLYKLEREAREAKLGLWCCNPVPPWAWRRGKRSCEPGVCPY